MKGTTSNVHLQLESKDDNIDHIETELLRETKWQTKYQQDTRVNRNPIQSENIRNKVFVHRGNLMKAERRVVWPMLMKIWRFEKLTQMRKHKTPDLHR